VSRLIDTLAADAPAAMAALASARASARARAWSLAGEHAPNHDASAASPLVIDVDATLVTAHSEKESAAPTFKRGFGFHPLWAFVDHGPEGTEKPLAFLLRPGNTGSNMTLDLHRSSVTTPMTLPCRPGGCSRHREAQSTRKGRLLAPEQARRRGQRRAAARYWPWPTEVRCPAAPVAPELLKSASRQTRRSWGAGRSAASAAEAAPSSPSHTPGCSMCA
jgi:hypothetical protein